MSTDQFKNFLEAVKKDSVLKEKLRAAPDAKDVVGVAENAGFDISLDDITLSLNLVPEQELEAGVGYFTAVSCNGDKTFLSSCDNETLGYGGGC